MIRPEWLDPQPPPEACAESVSVTDGLIEALQRARPMSPIPELLRLRREQGAERYGTELTTRNGRDPDLDLLQELVDALAYAGQSFLERPTPVRGQRMRRLHDEVLDLVNDLVRIEARRSGAT